MVELIQKLEELIVDINALPDHGDETIAENLINARQALSAARHRARGRNSIPKA